MHCRAQMNELPVRTDIAFQFSILEVNIGPAGGLPGRLRESMG